MLSAHRKCCSKQGASQEHHAGSLAHRVFVLHRAASDGRRSDHVGWRRRHEVGAVALPVHHGAHVRRCRETCAAAAAEARSPATSNYSPSIVDLHGQASHVRALSRFQKVVCMLSMLLFLSRVVCASVQPVVCNHESALMIVSAPPSWKCSLRLRCNQRRSRAFSQVAPAGETVWVFQFQTSVSLNEF